MKAGRTILSTIAVLVALLGLVWIGQGSGLFPYPASSFMINQSIWMFWGACLIVAAGILAYVSRRLN